MTLIINTELSLPDSEIQWQAIRAQGAGGQNVNKVSSAIHLRFDVAASSLPSYAKEAVLRLRDKRINTDGVIVIKASVRVLRRPIWKMPASDWRNYWHRPSAVPSHARPPGLHEPRNGAE